MKVNVLIIFFFLLIGCYQSGITINLNDHLECKKVTCENSVSFGDINICLPKIDGMTECYSVPEVKDLADQFNYEGNSILALYLNHATYRQLDNLGKTRFDDYVKIYGTNDLKGIKVGQAELIQFGKFMEENYISENWADFKKVIEERLKYVSFDVPVLIESYSLNSKVRTYVMLTKYLIENEEIVSIMTLNMINLKDRLIWLAYYKDYVGEESIKRVKSKNDYFIFRLLDENR